MLNVPCAPVAPRSLPARQLVNAWRDTALRYFWFVVPPDVLRFVPGSSRAAGPPRRGATWPSHRHKHDVSWRTVFAAREQTLPPPFYCNDPRVAFDRISPIAWPEFGVAEIRRGRLLDEHAWVVGSDDTFLGDFCHSGLAWHSPVNRIIKLHPVRRLTGRTLNLCTAYAVHNYFHYVIDGVSRWELVQRAGYTWDDFDQVVLPRYQTAATAEIDAALGIPEEKIVRMGRREHLECDVLVQPSFPGFAARTPWWVLDFYRGLFPGPARGEGRRVYLPRRGRRAPTNSTDIDARLAALGFEELDPVTTPRFRERLAAASHVVAVHGAALANLVHCRPATRVLEIIPTDIAYYRNFSYYYTICASGEMPYGAVIGRSLKERLTSFAVQVDAPFTVDLQQLDEGLARLLGT